MPVQSVTPPAEVAEDGRGRAGERCYFLEREGRDAMPVGDGLHEQDAAVTRRPALEARCIYVIRCWRRAGRWCEITKVRPCACWRSAEELIHRSTRSRPIETIGHTRGERDRIRSCPRRSIH